MYQEQVQSQQGCGEVVQPELLRDVTRSSSHCLVSPSLGVSWDPSFHTHSRARTGHLIPPVCGATEQKCLLPEVPPAGVQGTRLHPGIRSTTPFLCSVPAMQHAFRKALHPPSASGSSSVYQGRPPHPKAPPSAGRCWEYSRGGTGRSGNSLFPLLLRAFGRGLQHCSRDWACE